jgi:hypothetical protein
VPSETPAIFATCFMLDIGELPHLVAADLLVDRLWEVYQYVNGLKDLRSSQWLSPKGHLDRARQACWKVSQSVVARGS